MPDQHYDLTFHTDEPLTPEARNRLKDELASICREVLVIAAPVAIDQREE